jgi:hypothetical protein
MDSRLRGNDREEQEKNPPSCNSGFDTYIEPLYLRAKVEGLAYGQHRTGGDYSQSL